MMEDIQATYKNAQTVKPSEGQAVIALFPEDKVMYRAIVLEAVMPEYVVIFIDFGNKAKVTKVWPIDNKFLTLPRQAHCCALSGIIPNGDAWPNADQFSRYFGKETFDCTFTGNPQNPDM